MFSSSNEHMHLFGIPRPMTFDSRRWKPNVEIAPNCPRCDSSNTKFCYYNNYSLTQPRYFCKGCRRYWTKGGSLRNVPVGGGCSKNRRSRSVRLSRRTADSCNSSSGALRPDLALDGMAGSSQQSMVSQTESSGGDRIDLGMLYLKFLNQCPVTEQEQEGFVPELSEPVGLTSSDHLGGTLDTDAAMMIGEMSYAFDASGFESVLTMPAAEEVFPGLEWLQATELQQAGLCQFPEVHMGHHLQGSDWSSLDQSSFGAF